ncbi:hypothetical protein U14_04839 [Candidatus Moduliflexus flocculans]|uniref:SGNH hydrolase-type esterase domain-containing protein n=1 Tax=Candidatus Moduliflexus flocculans TaxID=1499966 RepID=A0A0S6W196_9BACT|nr:hypothetical protein U14_04839 [Candidatus Moduliflexus flocculans]
MKQHQIQFFVNISLSCASVLFAFVFLELASRTYGNMWQFINFSGVFLQQPDIPFDSVSPAVYDATSGWIPRTGSLSLWGKTVTILENGVRSNGLSSTNIPDAPRILAVGDSYTFGDMVEDHETWPAVLEQRSGIRVINGGVFGFGVDQAFLRAKILLDVYQPNTLIFSLIPDDIYRAELSVRVGTNKPYFEIDNGKLVLRNSPVPQQTTTHRQRDWFRKISGYSFLIHSVMIRLSPNYWIEPGSSVRVHHRGSEVANLLMKELKRLTDERRIRLIVLIQYDILTISAYLKKADRLREFLEEQGIEVIDLQAALREISTTDPSRYERFFNKVGYHMSAEGNAFVAEQFEKAFKSR